MAINSFNPYYPPYYQPPYQPTASSATNPANGVIWVKDVNDASTYPIAPNTAIALWDLSSPTIYLKQADVSGRPSMKIYDLVERKEPAQTSDVKYATKQDVMEIGEVITTLKNELDKMSNDLYGIAGKKRTSKKIRDEEEEDE